MNLEEWKDSVTEAAKDFVGDLEAIYFFWDWHDDLVGEGE